MNIKGEAKGSQLPLGFLSKLTGMLVNRDGYTGGKTRWSTCRRNQEFCSGLVNYEMSVGYLHGDVWWATGLLDYESGAE